MPLGCSDTTIAQCPCPHTLPRAFPKAVGGTPAGIVGLHKRTEWVQGWNQCGCAECPCAAPAARGTPTGLGDTHLAAASNVAVSARTVQPAVACQLPPCAQA